MTTQCIFTIKKGTALFAKMMDNSNILVSCGDTTNVRTETKMRLKYQTSWLSVLTLLLRMREFPVSNLSLETSYPD
jgi:hypothetical protein